MARLFGGRSVAISERSLEKNMNKETLRQFLSFMKLNKADYEIWRELLLLSGKPRGIRRRLDWHLRLFRHRLQGVRDTAIMNVAQIAKTDSLVIERLMELCGSQNPRLRAEACHAIGHCEKKGQKAKNPSKAVFKRIVLNSN